MAKHRSWEALPISYRAKEMETIARWIVASESGSVVGQPGTGRSWFLEFLCYRSDALKLYMPRQFSPVILVPVDLNTLPTNDAATLYRTILRACYRIRDRFTEIDASLPQTITDFYLETRGAQDPFLPQSALDDLLLQCQELGGQIVLVLNRFDRFCETATPAMINTLRAMRDNMKETLSYIVGMRQEVVYLSDPAELGDMYDILDMRVCWVGAMADDDAQHMVTSLIHTADIQPTEAEIDTILALSGNFPALIRAICNWWLDADSHAISPDNWPTVLLAEPSVRYRLDKLWQGLTQEEQLVISEIQKLQTQAPQTKIDSAPQLNLAYQMLAKRQATILARLAATGLCYEDGYGWWIQGKLLAAYIAEVEGRVRGRIWLDETTGIIYQGTDPLTKLSGLPYAILYFCVKNPYVKHTRDDIIDHAWPEEDQRDGITPNALQVHIASLRKVIELNSAKPQYLVTWHGRPSGYQFFPEGKPS